MMKVDDLLDTGTQDLRRRMRIAHIAIDHPPLDVRVFYKQCRTLASAGHDVHLVTSGPAHEQRDGVRFHSIGPRLKAPRLPAPLRRARLMAAQLGRLYRVFRTARNLHADVYHLHEPSLILAGLLLKSRGVKIVYDAHEEHRQVAHRVRQRRPLWGRVLYAWYALLEKGAERRCDTIVAATPAIARQFRRPTIVRNYPVLIEFDPANTRPYRDRSPRIIYIGGISEIRGAYELIQAIGLLPAALQAGLDLVGDFKSPIGLEAALRREPGWEYVDFHDWQGRQEVARLLGEARVGIVVFHPVPNHTEALPNKLFEYMAAGIPVVASDFPVWREIVEGAGCGLLVDPRDSVAIAAAIRWLIEHPTEAEEMGRRGLEAVRTRYDWNIEAVTLLSLYDDYRSSFTTAKRSPSAADR